MNDIARIVDKVKNRFAAKPFVLPEDVKTAVSMRGISSMERYAEKDGAETPVLRNVTFDVPAGSVFGVTGADRFALRLTAEIAGSLKPHENGRCILMETGMMRKKRRILPHVFYINDQDVLYDHMEVLAYLMFVSDACGLPGAKLQERWLELMLKTGTYRMALTRIGELFADERALVSLLAADASKARIVVADLSGLEIFRERKDEFASLFAHMTEQGKTVLVVNADAGFIGHCCTHAALLSQGEIKACGTVKELCDKYDHRLVTVNTDEPEKAAKLMEERYPSLRIVVAEGAVKLYGEGDVLEVMAMLQRENIQTNGMVTGAKTLEEAFEEVQRL